MLCTLTVYISSLSFQQIIVLLLMNLSSSVVVDECVLIEFGVLVLL